MANSETGHAKNVANFEALISFCTGYGASYNPSKSSIKLPTLTTLLTAANDKMSEVKTAESAWSDAVGAREILFKPLSKLTTRVLNALASSDVPASSVDNAKTIANKIQGKRATPKNSPPPIDPAVPKEETPQNISASQMGFDNRIDNLDKLIKLLIAQPGYAPNETVLTTASLTTLLADMRAANTAAIGTNTVLSNARIERDKVLYKPETGLVDIVDDVKKYVKSLFGASTPQYKQISGLKFTRPRK
ncbi:MAG: hypothetical protein Q8S01_02235 [Ignavibacteria bacterium]|nr:hypothetical protein [Ignavibacteria bacterium]